MEVDNVGFVDSDELSGGKFGLYYFDGFTHDFYVIISKENLEVVAP